MQLSTIPVRMQPDVISSFWAMLGELRTQADNSDDRVLKVQVEGWYRQWNAMTGDNKTPCWSPTTSVEPSLQSYAGSLEYDTIAGIIRRVVAATVGLTPDALEAHSTLESLGADSLDEIELVMALEDEFAIELEDELAESMTTLDRAVEVIVQKLNAVRATQG